MSTEEVREDAKKIMDEFMDAMQGVKGIQHEFGLIRVTETREGKASKEDAEFSKLMLENAPKVKDGCVQAEKKSW